MGCGASTPDGGPPLEHLQRDPSDFNLEYLELQPSAIPEFDLTFSEIEEVLNKLVALNNDVNDCLSDVKASYAVCAGDRLIVEVGVGFRSTDHVLLNLYIANSFTIPSSQKVRFLVESSEYVRQADVDLNNALIALHGALLNVPHGQHASLSVNQDSLLDSSMPLPEVQEFNSRLSAFRDLLGKGMRVGLSVKPSLAPGAQTVRAMIRKPVVENKPEWAKPPEGWEAPLAAEPATLLDILATEDAWRLKKAEAAVVDRAHRLALYTRELDRVNWQVLHKHKVSLAVAIPDPLKRNQVRAALVDTNTALFRLVNSGASSKGPATLAMAVGEVARQVCLEVRRRWAEAGGPPLPLKKLLIITSTLHFKEAGLFEHVLAVEALPQADIGTFPACLPPHAQELLLRLEVLSSTIASALSALPAISSQLDALVEQAREFYELAPEAAARKNMPMMEAVKAGKAVGANLKVVFESQQLFRAFAANVKRVADDLAEAQDAINQVMQQQSEAAGVGQFFQGLMAMAPDAAAPAAAAAAAAGSGSGELATSSTPPGLPASLLPLPTM